VAPPDWHERYDHRVKNPRLPEAEAKREAYAVQVGADGFLLLDTLDHLDAPEGVPALPAVAVLRRVWARHFERPAPDDDGAGKGGLAVVRLLPLRTRDDNNRPIDRIALPYDTEARFRTRAGREWVGYIAHFTETCDEGAPRLVMHAETTDASVHEAMRVGSIHDALAGKGLAPAEHLVDAAYVATDQLVAARMQHSIDLIGPQRRNMSWQGAASDAFDVSDFAVDWNERVVRCPEGKESAAWATYANRKRPHRCALVRAGAGAVSRTRRSAGGGQGRPARDPRPPAAHDDVPPRPAGQRGRQPAAGRTGPSRNTVQLDGFQIIGRHAIWGLSATVGHLKALTERYWT